MGLLVGAAIGFIAVQAFLKKQHQDKIDEMNRKADMVVQEARLTAKRLVDEAEIKAEKVVSSAENRNEQIKQQKIQEAKEKFNKMKAEMDAEKANWQGLFEKEKAQHQLQMKDREINVVSQENELKQKRRESWIMRMKMVFL